MYPVKIKNLSLLILSILLSTLLIACGGNSSKETISAEEKKSMEVALETLSQDIPDAFTTLPYSSNPSSFTANKKYSFQAQGLPSWASFNSKTGRISGTPSKKDSGTSKVTLYLSMGDLTITNQISLKVVHSSSFLDSNAIGYYDHQFGGADRVLRNDLFGKIEGEVQFMQSHNVRPNGNFQRDTGDETISIYSPRLVALREALVFFTPTNIENVQSIEAVLSLNGEIQTTLSMLHPNDTYAADYNGNTNVVFSNKAWSTALPWQYVKNGLSIRFIINKNTSTEALGEIAAANIDIGEATQVAFQSIRLGMLTHVDIKSGHYTLNNHSPCVG